MKTIPSPSSLKYFQEIFSESIITPFALSNSNYLQKEKYSQSLTEMILDGTNKSSRDRLSTYNEQYWFRLLTTLQNELPTTLEHLGIETFNQLMMDYLVAHPSTSFTLNHLTYSLTSYCKEQNKPFPLLKTIELDTIYLISFLAEEKPFPEGIDIETYLFHLQDHVFLFEDSYDVYSFKCKKTQQINIKNTSSVLYIFFRKNGVVQAKILSRSAYLLLKEIKNGVSLQNIFSNISLSEEEVVEVENHLTTWFQSWRENNWLI